MGLGMAKEKIQKEGCRKEEQKEERKEGQWEGWRKGRGRGGSGFPGGCW